MSTEPPGFVAPHPASPRPRKRIQSLIFHCGDDTYALPVVDVYKVIDHHSAPISRLPRLHEKVVGIAQHRGRIITVLDARHLLDIDDNTPLATGPLTKILILDRASRSIGILVHSVGEISSLVSTLESAGGLTSPCSFQGDVVHLIDTERLLNLAVTADDLDQARFS